MLWLLLSIPVILLVTSVALAFVWLLDRLGVPGDPEGGPWP